MKYKTCFKCKEIKPTIEFYKHPEMTDGHLNKCKECTKKDVSENYRINIDHYVDYELIRNKTEKRKQQKASYQRKRRVLYPEKYKANNATTNAIRDGRLIKQPCETCGDNNAQAHHDDYSVPLDVRWLCFKCHREYHGQAVR